MLQWRNLPTAHIRIGLAIELLVEQPGSLQNLQFGFLLQRQTPLGRSGTQEMNERVDSVRRHIGIDLEVIACIERSDGIAPSRGAMQEVMQGGIYAPFGNIGIGTKVIS